MFPFGYTRSEAGTRPFCRLQGSGNSATPCKYREIWRSIKFVQDGKEVYLGASASMLEMCGSSDTNTQLTATLPNFCSIVSRNPAFQLGFPLFPCIAFCLVDCTNNCYYLRAGSKRCGGNLSESIDVFLSAHPVPSSRTASTSHDLAQAGIALAPHQLAGEEQQDERDDHPAAQRRSGGEAEKRKPR
jgi:hypothetical protein